MHCHRCGACCQQTDMLLSSEDITRLEKKGYDRSFFARFDNAGYALLRNHQGSCVFYNASTHDCKVYACRPSGCRVYPVILDEDKGIVVDDICHSQTTISKAEKKRRGKRVMKLLEKIDSEAKTRRRSSP
jgi:Fe-S-cluster containining protein